MFTFCVANAGSEFISVFIISETQNFSGEQTYFGITSCPFSGMTEAAYRQAAKNPTCTRYDAPCTVTDENSPPQLSKRVKRKERKKEA